MERNRTPYTHSELPVSHMDRQKLSRPQPESTTSIWLGDLESNGLARPPARNFDSPTTSLWQHYYLSVRSIALSAYRNLRLGIPALFVWTAQNLKGIATEPTILTVVIHGLLLFLFWTISFEIADLTEYDSEPPAWLPRLWGSLCLFEVLFGIYVLQSLCGRVIRKIGAVDPVSPLTLWVRSCQFKLYVLIVTKKKSADRGTNSFNLF